MPTLLPGPATALDLEAGGWNMFADWFATGDKATVICNGCGRVAEPIERSVAVAVISKIVEGFTGLKQARQGTMGQPLKVVDAADRAASALSSIDSQLRRLSVFDTLVPAGKPPSCANTAPTPSLLESAARLGWTLKTLPDLCWYQATAIEGFSPAEMTWLALHQATHSLEDARLMVANDTRLEAMSEAGRREERGG